MIAGNAQWHDFHAAFVQHVGHVSALCPGTRAHAGQQRVAHRLERRTVPAMGRLTAEVAFIAAQVRAEHFAAIGELVGFGFRHGRPAFHARAVFTA